MNHEKLNQKIIACQKCPRLIEHCQSVAREKRKSFQTWDYWGKPVPNFGDPKAQLLILGLAPAAHGANRTGRMFTGDRSGDWLYRALHKAGFANQALCNDVSDGLKLQNCLITAVGHCAPPDNKPTLQEIKNCQPFLQELLESSRPKVIICLGKIAWDAAYDYFKSQDLVSSRPKFSHGAEMQIPTGPLVVASFHPSQQNTFTGKLTEPMFDKIFSRAKRILKH